MSDFGTLNWSILIAYVLLNLLLGWVLSKKVDTAEDFYLGRRTTPWWAIGISVIATYVSALSFLGGPAWSYSESLAVIAIHLNYPIVVFFVITLFLPFFFNSGVASIYDYMEDRFGPTSRLVISSVFLISQALTSAAILYATSLVIEFITGIDVKTAIVIVTVVALIYTMMGGITAVIWTDVIQAGVLFVGAFIILFALLDSMPMPIGEVLADLKAQGKTNPLNFSFDLSLEATVWSGVIAMSLFHVTVYGANQMMVQRTLAAKNIGDAKKSFLLMGFIAFFIYFLFFFLGILFYGYYGGQEFENGNTIILDFAANYGLPGLMGIIAAAIVAASMSTLDSSFNSLATISTIDFYQKYFRKNESPEHYLMVSRGFTVFWAVVIIIPAIMYSALEGSVLQTLSKIGSYFVGAKLSMYGLGFFSKQTTEKGLLTGVVFGFVMVWYLSTQTDIAWPWFCLFGGAVNIAVSLIASRIIDGPQAEWSEFSIKGQQKMFKDKGLPEKDGGWYLVPGKVDKVSYLLLVFFVLTILFLFFFERLI
ncbi:MAG: sodium/solute symporter [Gammaproteobacteria bacterium]|nr:sodium/solute symporter [Gammaproteobacteria bacterium]